MVVDLDHIRVIDRRADRPLARLVESLEAVLELLRLERVEDLQPHDLARLLVAGHVKVRHRARDRLAHQLIPGLHVQPWVEERLEVAEETHVSALRLTD